MEQDQLTPVVRPAESGTHHHVSANPAGYFEVRSTRSGQVYRVVPWASGLWADCNCKGFQRRGTCSHVEAVVTFSAGVLR